MHIIWALFLSFSWVGADPVQSPQCLGPAGAPVAAVYMHGWFSKDVPKKGEPDHWTVKLEKANRTQLAELAKKLNIRIAVPIAKGFNPKNGYREWPDGRGSATKKILEEIERNASRACGAPLATPRSLIGFSNGGFAARNQGLACQDNLKAYSNILMIGAKPLEETTREGSFSGCPTVHIMSGSRDDGTETCKKHPETGEKTCISFQEMATRMKRALARQDGKAEITVYPGGHVLPSQKLMEDILRAKAVVVSSDTPKTNDQDPGKSAR